MKKTKEEETPTGDRKIEIRRSYPKLFAETGNNSKKRLDVFERVKAEENIYRELFAKERNSKELDDPYALLIDPHACPEIFTKLYLHFRIKIKITKFFFNL